VIYRKTSARIALITAAAATATLGLTACSTSTPAPTTSDVPVDNAIYDMLPDSIKEAGVITAGALFQTPPGIGADESAPDVAVGFIPDLGAALEPILGVEIEFVNTEWPNQIPGIQAGNIDILWGQISDTVEREQSVFDMIPFSYSTNGLLVAGGNPLGIDSIASMCGLKAAVPNGGIQATEIQAISDTECVAAGKPAIEQVTFAGGADAVTAVKAGTVDAWMDSYSSIQGSVDADPSAFAGVELSTDESPANIGAIAVLKENTALTEALFAALTELRDSGAYAAVYDSFGLPGYVVPDDLFMINTLTGTPVGEVVAG
jgi:polar amino acid transport system substrate-binding protein